VGQLKFAAQSKVSRDDPIRGRQLLLNVDNFCELRIFTRADKLLKQYQKQNPDIINPLLIGFFPGERIFTSAASGRSSLYSNNPGQALEDRYGNSLRPMDVVTKVFGRSPTKIVQLLLEEEGIIMLSN